MNVKDNFFLVIRGEERELEFRIVDGDGNPLAVGAPAEMVARFRNADDTILSKTKTGGGVLITNDDRGEFKVKFNEAESKLFDLVERKTMIIDRTIGTVTRKIRFLNALTVESDPLDP